MSATRPKIVCLCGSTRFWREFQRASLAETLAGHIVLSVEPTDASHQHDSVEADKALKARLDELHLRKIDLADEVLVLNVGGYVGESTAREVAYAWSRGKTLRWLEVERQGRREPVMAYWDPDSKGRLEAATAAYPQQDWDDAVREAATCPYCGHVAEVETADARP